MNALQDTDDSVCYCNLEAALFVLFFPGSGQEGILQRIRNNPKVTPRQVPENAA